MKPSSIVIAALLFAGLGCATAAPITYRVTATINHVDPALAGNFSVGQAMQGLFTYESTAAMTDCSCVGQTGFAGYNAGSFQFEVGDDLWSRSISGIQVANDHFGRDRFVLVSSGLDGPEFNDRKGIGFLSLDDTSATAFSSTGLAEVGDLSQWLGQPGRSGSWYLSFGLGGGTPSIRGTIDAVTAVPEPSTLLLAAACLAALPLAARRRRTDGTAPVA